MVGIYKTNNATKSLTINPKVVAAAAFAKAKEAAPAGGVRALGEATNKA